MITLKINQNLHQKAFSSMENKRIKSVQTLHNRTGEGNDYLGWMDLPVTVNAVEENIISTANYLRNISECIVVIGIGGSYLGARAVISALKNDFTDEKPEIIYAGHHLSEDYYVDLLQYLNTVNYSLIVISKSGTTTEPAIAFRLLKQHCEMKYGTAEAKNRIVCITDARKGILKEIAQKEKYTTFEIPDNVGGRYSALSPVGLLPIALAGCDIHALLMGAKTMQQQCLSSENNRASHYAMYRNYFLKQGLNIEVLSAFEPKLHYLIEWWKQLYAESEGKNGKGIFPAGMIFTTDLHSLGQYMQDGQRMMFETILSVSSQKKECIIPCLENDEDKLNFLSGKKISDINNAAEKATILAHQQGNIPIMKIIIELLNEKNMGALIYFFEYSCAVSAYMLGINPFDQPGVEAYKNNMFALLDKPGYEQKSQQVKQNLSDL
ncbi:MAG: glucose-6-phosphate isomerase [Bacteroidales bacterium]|jgi:glucose-6-phosphate isomerase|nr:glucose-6-phosphate isomerase [Bacteroidales bacterium]